MTSLMPYLHARAAISATRRRDLLVEASALVRPSPAALHRMVGAASLDEDTLGVRPLAAAHVRRRGAAAWVHQLAVGHDFDVAARSLRRFGRSQRIRFDDTSWRAAVNDAAYVPSGRHVTAAVRLILPHELEVAMVVTGDVVAVGMNLAVVQIDAALAAANGLEVLDRASVDRLTRGAGVLATADQLVCDGHPLRRALTAAVALSPPDPVATVAATTGARQHAR